MKKQIIILLFLVQAICGWSENVEHENILKLQYGGSWRQDQYLSPLLYKGMMVGIGNEWWQQFSKSNNIETKDLPNCWEHVGKLNISFDWTYNPTKSNVLYSVQLDFGWGAYYAWKWKKYGVKVLLGPYLKVDNTLKYHVRNVNKPLSLDAASHIMIMGGISYSFSGKKTTYRLRYLLQANAIGIDFMPDYWESYYELSELVHGDIRVAGMWNHRILEHELTLDMQFPHSTWRVGIAHEYNEYGSTDMKFSREQVSVIVGTCFHYRLKPEKKLTDL